MKNVVIFGATGNVGVYVVDYLKNNLNLWKKKYKFF